MTDYLRCLDFKVLYVIKILFEAYCNISVLFLTLMVSHILGICIASINLYRSCACAMLWVWYMYYVCRTGNSFVF